MTGSSTEERAAILLCNLDSEAAANVLACLGPRHRTRLQAEMERLAQAPPPDDVLQDVLREFEELLRRGEDASPWKPTLVGADEPSAESPSVVATAPVRPTPVSPPAPSPPAAAEPAPRVPPDPSDPLAALRLLGPDRLAAALQGEQPHTVSLVLNALEAEEAGEVLKRLVPEMRREVTLRLSHGVSSAAPVLQRIARALLAKSQALSQTPSQLSNEAKLKKMADMLRLLDKPDRMEILTALEENDADLAGKLKEFLYQFEDLLLIEDRSMQKLLGEIDSKSLGVALKGAPEEIRDKVLNNLSKRARETLNEEMEFLGSVSSAQVQQAQKAVVEIFQRLDQAGELAMKE